MLDLKDEWLAAFGRVEANAKMLVWGGSGQGKTRFVLQLAKCLTQFGRVAYNSLEMGDSLALADALNDENLMKNIIILNRENMQQLKTRMQARKSPQILIIDSLQYLRHENGNGINYAQYIEMKSAMAEKMLVMISHADGREPSGRVAKTIRYDVDVKIFVQGFKAFVTSRYGGGDPLTIWKQGAAEYYGI